MAEDRDPPAPVPGQRAIASLIPFGIGAEQPHLLRDLAAGVWENRDNLSFAWNLLNTGVCDGCALGPRGLRDEVLPGVHLCARRLRDLRRQTMPALAPADLLDIDRLRHMDRESLENLGRISYPYVYRPGDRGFSRLSWTEALDVVRERCAGIPPDRMGFLAAGRGLTNEAYFALSKTARLLGSNHIDLCSDAGPSNGLAEALGEDTATCSLSDLIGTDLLLVIGTRLVADQPVAAKYLAEAKARGTRIVVVAPSLDPGLDRTWEPSSARTAVFGARLVDDFIRVEDGGAPAFLTGVLKALQARGGENTAFIQASTSGWEALAAELRGLPWSALEVRSGASARQMAWVADLLTRARTAVTTYDPSDPTEIGGHTTATAVIHLHLAAGMIGRPKCGILPLGGPSGASGSRDCGVSPLTFPGPRPISPQTAGELSGLWGGLPVPSAPGRSARAMLAAAREGAFDLLYTMGGDLLRFQAEPGTAAETLDRIRVRIHQDLALNPSTLPDPGELTLLLPAQTRFEQRGGGTTTSAERRVQFSPEIPDHPTVGECRADWEIPGQIAAAMRPDLARALSWPDATALRTELAQIVRTCAGVERMGMAGDWVQVGGPQRFTDGRFLDRPDGRARFTPIRGG